MSDDDWEAPPLLGLVKVTTDFTKTYELCGHGPDRIEIRRVSSIGGYATPVAVVLHADTDAPVWDFSDGAYLLSDDEQAAILRELARLRPVRGPGDVDEEAGR